jgi:hypothetical protein
MEGSTINAGNIGFPVCSILLETRPEVCAERGIRDAGSAIRTDPLMQSQDLSFRSELIRLLPFRLTGCLLCIFHPLRERGVPASKWLSASFVALTPVPALLKRQFTALDDLTAPTVFIKSMFAAGTQIQATGKPFSS